MDGFKRVLFWTATLLIPLLFFAVLEVGLRIAGVGGDYPLFVPVPGYEEYLHPNPETGRRYFARTSVVPAPMHDAFRAERASNTLRIFVQGASTVAGFPYGHNGSFSRMLEQRLAATLPNREVEVVNTAMAAVSSHTLRDQTREIIEARPDAVLIYAGHNEYYGALGAASTESIGSLASLYLAVDHFRIVQGLRQLWVRLTPSPRPDAPGATLMHEMARRRSIPFGSLLYLRGIRQFEANLRAMLCRYRDAGVPVFIGTVAANDRDLPPFVSGLAEQTDTASWNAAFRAVTSSPPADSGRALAVLDSLIKDDDLSADAYFARARLHEAAGRLEQARADYRAARDRDELRFRAPEAINQTIREVAGECGAVIVETRDALAEASPVGVVGDAVMLEHVHPNLDGYFLLSDTYYEALQQAGFFDSTRAIPAQIARQDMLVTALDSALADLHVRRLRNNWPFQPPGVTRPDTITVSNPVDVLALDVLRGRRGWLDATAALGAQYEAIGDLDAALRVARALLIEQSYDPQPYILAGNILLRQGRFAPAFSFFQAADAQGASAEARALAGHALIRGGRPVDAIPWIHRALEIEPDHGSALYDLAVANAELGRADEARRAADRLRQVDPDGPATRRLLTRLNLTSSLPELAFDSAGAGRSEP